MDAEIIAVGSELLTPDRLDTNSLYLTAELNALGVEVVTKTIVGDDRSRLAEAIRAARGRSPILILTGGLGPTEDDVTRDAVAEALGLQQTFRQDVCDWIEDRFRRMNRVMAEINKRQAYILDGAEILANDRGTAPGQWITLSNGAVLLLPGPPNELKAMWTKQCVSRLEKIVPQQVIRTRFYRVAGMGESDLDQLIAPVYKEYTNPVTTILAGPSDIQIHLRARCAEAAEAERLLAEVGPRIEALLGDRTYTSTGETLEAVVGAMLRARGATLVVAESCTGGALGARITSVAGSSDYFAGGFLTYTNAMKTALVDVPAELLDRYTAESEEAAEAMARGSLARTSATYAISVTGIAGPSGGSDDKPVGSVWIGVADRQACQVRRFRFLGDRERVRALAVQTALDLLRRKLMAV